MNQNGDSKIIGMLNEGELHAALKLHYGGHGARYEEKIQGFVVDVVRDDVVYEIETSSLSGKDRKYRALSEHNEVVLVYPIALKTTLVHEQDGETVRKISPKKGDFSDVFRQLVFMPTIIDLFGFSLEVALIEQEVDRVFDQGIRRGRGGWRKTGRRLVNFDSAKRITGSDELLNMLIEIPDGDFSVRDISAITSWPLKTARQYVYCLRQCRRISVSGKTGNALLYRLEEALA